MATRTLQIVLAGDSASARREFSRVEQSAGKMGKTLDREGKNVRGFATITSRGFSRVGVAATAMQTVAVGAVGLMAKSMVDSASSIAESLSKNEVIFGKQAEAVERFSKRSATAFGISRQAALEATGTFGNLFTALEIGPKKAAGMSVALTKLAADLASFNNASPEEALEAIRSGLVGETEPLRKFGVNLNDATLRTEALRMGLVKNTKEALEPQTKALAVNSLLFEQTKKAQGDFARTSDGLANQQRILKARLSDISGELGARLLPFANRAVSALNDLIAQTQRGEGPLVKFRDRIMSVVGAMRDSVNWFRRHKTTTDVLLSAVVGLTAAFVAYKVAVIAAAIATRALTAAAILLNIAFRANPIGLIVTAVIALGAALVTAYHRSETFRKIVDKAFVGAKRGAQVAASVFNSVLLPGLRAVAAAAEKVWSAMKKVGGILGAVGGAASDAAGFLNPFGDGLGKSAVDIAGLGGSGGLMGADADLAPFAAMGRQAGLHVSSGIRPGAITSSGNQSFHATGDAIDQSGSPSAMMRFATGMRKNFGGRLRELIYTPMGIGIKDGRPYQYSGQVAADHFDHVHLAFTGPFGDGIGQAASAAKAAGFRGQNLINAVAIAGPESGYRNSARLVTSQEDSRGMWQINTLAHPWARGMDLSNPNVAAKAAYRVFSQAGSFSPWTAFSSGSYRAYLARARAAVQGSTRSVGGAGGGGGGPSAEGPSRRSETPTGPGARLGMEGQLARVGVREARAQASDNLAKLIQARKQKRAILTKRLRVVSKALRGRMRKARRVRLLNEQAQLVEEIDALTESIVEYEADQAGGATTITAAEGLDAGVDTSGGGVEAGGGGDSGAGALAAAIAENTAAMTASLKFAQQVQSTESFQLKKYLADMYSGYVVGYGVVPRSFTPGSGVDYAY